MSVTASLDKPLKNVQSKLPYKKWVRLRKICLDRKERVSDWIQRAIDNELNRSLANKDDRRDKVPATRDGRRAQ